VSLALTEFTQLSAQQGVEKSYPLSDKSNFNIVQKDPYSLKIIYSAGQLEVLGITNQHGDFYRLQLPGHHSTSDPGKPELPVISTLISIPSYSSLSITYKNVITKQIAPSNDGFKGLLYPAQPGQVKSKTQKPQNFILDNTTYLLNSYSVSDTIKIEYAGSMRGEKLATLSLLPARYNPVKNVLEVIVSMEVEIDFLPSEPATQYARAGIEALPTLPSDEKSKSFLPDQLINGYSDNPVGLIILTDTAFRKQIEPLVKWKTQKGFKVTTLFVGSDFAGATNTAIRDSLKKIYLAGTADASSPEYLLIIGNLSFVPQSPSLGGSKNLSDLYYGEYTEGGDFIPEMYIGRLPAKDTAAVRSQVKKIIQYEKFQFADTNTFYKNALITAGDDAAHSTLMNGHVNYSSQNYINAGNGINPTVFLYPNSASMDDSVRAILNKGVGFVNYTGHGAPEQWDKPLFTYKSVDSLKNVNMYPFIISNACHTAQFDIAQNLGSAFVMAENKGAIGFIGCTNYSYWDEDFYYAVGATTISLNPEYLPDKLGFYDRLFHSHGELPSGWYYTMGQINVAGNLAVTASTTTRKRYYWETYHLLGDPSIIPVIGEPVEIVTNLPDTLPKGISSLYITAPPFTYAAISGRDTLWDASFVSPSGSVTLSIPANAGDSCLVVITGQNNKPLIRTIYFSNIAGSYINIDSIIINDLTGNNNGKADYGESLFIGMELENPGSAASSDAWARISSDSEWLTIIDDSVFIGVINAGSTIRLHEAFKVTIGNDIPNFGLISYKVTIYDNGKYREYLNDMVVNAPVVSVTAIRIDDSSEGNGNLLPDQGESINILFAITNTGMSPASGIFRIVNNPDGINLDVSEVATGIMQPGITNEVSLRGTISPAAIPGDKIVLETFLDCGFYTDIRSFTLSVGKTMESFESGTFTVFPWQNTSTSPWLISTAESYEGHMSAVSGIISHNGITSLKINVDLAESDTIKFWYKVSSESGWDALSFSVDGAESLKASGEIEWTYKEVILEAGRHLLDWNYSKDASVSSGMDRAWIDMISFPPTSFAERDIALTSLLSPITKEDYGEEDITVVVKNMGSNQINGFNLAYRVTNMINHEWQYFSNTIPVRDSVIVTFNQKLDLSKLNIYDIAVYGFGNDDDYVLNDTIKIRIENTHIKTAFLIYPNPYTEGFNLFISSAIEEFVTISIENTSGKTMEIFSTMIVNGDNTINIVPRPLPAGVYIIKVKGEIIEIRTKVIKL